MMSESHKLFHLRNLILLSKADGKELQEEIGFIKSVMDREGLSEEDYTYCTDNMDAIDYSIPEDYNERVEYLYDMIKLMIIDGHVDEKELKVCEECAELMKIPPASVNNMVKNMISLIQTEINE